MYVRDVVFETNFEGKKVRAVMSPLTFDDSLAVEGIDDKLDDRRYGLALVKALRAKLPSYVKEFDGPMASDGSVVSIEEVTSVAYFAQLIGGMASALVRASFPPPTPPAASGS